jgi:RNA polymerase sigma-70 factor (ECF subfamily)
MVSGVAIGVAMMNAPLPSCSRVKEVKACELRRDLELELPRLRARARRLCGNDADAADLVQDTVMRALSYEASFVSGTNLGAWLMRIQETVFLSRCRRSGRGRRALLALSVDPCAWPQREAQAPSAGLTSAATRALRTLPDGFRKVVELVDLHDFEYRDAAAELGVPIGTVMSRLHRGRRLLRAGLGEKASSFSETPRAA